MNAGMIQEAHDTEWQNGKVVEVMLGDWRKIRTLRMLAKQIRAIVAT